METLDVCERCSEGGLGWRDEIDVALQEWIAMLGGGRGGSQWVRVGAARPDTNPGSYVVDIRAAGLTADEADGLKLAGFDERTVAKGFPVLDATIDGEVLRVRVAVFADVREPYLWRLRQEPAFLVTALRGGIAGLKDAGLANRLARGEIGGVLSPADPPAGWSDAQGDAYRACRGEGLWLVWGPPGTGKTKVLRAAISDLVAEGKRVLLVSATNIAVDNALLGAVRDRGHRPGTIIRVGTPQLREIAGDPSVCLPLMVRAQLAQVEEQRHAVEADLLEMKRRKERLRDLGPRLTGFDPAEYETAMSVLSVPGGSVAETSDALTRAQQQVEANQRAIEAARDELDTAEAAAAEAAPFRDRELADVERLESRLAGLVEALNQSESLVVRAQVAYANAEEEAARFRESDGKVRFRDRRAHSEARKRAEQEREKYEQLRGVAAEARRVARIAQQDKEAAITRLEASSGLSLKEIQRRDAAVIEVKTRVRGLERAQRSMLAESRTLREKHAAAVAAEELVAVCTQRGWPTLHATATALRREVTRDEARQRTVEERHAALQEQYAKLAKDAEGEIIRAARVVATTLAKFRLVKAVLGGPYDAVLIDEVGAAMLPDVLLAVAKADKCAVLFGDFMQLGPVVTPRALKESKRPDVQRWLIPDPFRHCGIFTPADAERNEACLVLTEQHRFGPNVMRLANLLAYDGRLTAGREIHAHDSEDPEIVLIDTDGLHNLAEVRRTSSSAGWWPAGLLLSRALVELHHEQGEPTGVVTPYTAQAEATLEALRDVEAGGGPLAEVGTAHRFQGREFPVVVFDTVEPWYGGGLWMGLASRLPGSSSWEQEGVRLFNVATTRVRHRLYVIVSRTRVERAKAGTALAHLGTLLNGKLVRSVPATSLIAPPTWEAPFLGPEGKRLAEVLSRHVEITDINDERSFYEQFAQVLSGAKNSIWLWSAWVASRVRSLLPLLQEAVDRGVQITVFVRDPSDRNQQRADFAAALADLRTVVPRVIEVNVLHQKVVIVDDHTVMLGSLNVLSHHRSREVMITMRGRHWARKLFTHLHAEEFSRPPRCSACGGQQVDLRQTTKGDWYWRCYNPTCPKHGKGRYNAWTQPVMLKNSPS